MYEKREILLHYQGTEGGAGNKQVKYFSLFELGTSDLLNVHLS